MSDRAKIFLGILGIAFVTAPFFVYIIITITSEGCVNDVYTEYLSQDKSLKAVVYQRKCGSSTSRRFYTHVSILNTRDELKDEGGNIYIIQDYPKNIASKISWKSNEILLINNELNGMQIKAENSWGLFSGVKIIYGNSRS